MLRVNDGLKPTLMTPLVPEQEDRGLKPAPMTPVQPKQPAPIPATPAETPNK